MSQAGGSRRRQVTAAEVAAWWAALARAAEAETCFLAVLGFIAVGRKR